MSKYKAGIDRREPGWETHLRTMVSHLVFRDNPHAVKGLSKYIPDIDDIHDTDDEPYPWKLIVLGDVSGMYKGERISAPNCDIVISPSVLSPEDVYNLPSEDLEGAHVRIDGDIKVSNVIIQHLLPLVSKLEICIRTLDLFLLLARRAPPVPPDDIVSSNPSAPIVVEEDWDMGRLIIVDKPPRISSVELDEEDSLESLYPGFRSVHRLDYTSQGLLIMADSDPLRSFFRMLFAFRKVEKTYRIQMDGRPLRRDLSVWVCIKEDPKNVSRMKLVAKCDRPVQTHFHPVNHHMADVSILSGKRHQVRLSAVSIRRPLVGDHIYNSSSREDIMRLRCHRISTVFRSAGINIEAEWTATPDYNLSPFYPRSKTCSESKIEV